MENSKIQEIIEKQMLTVAKAMEDKIDEEIHALDQLDLDDLEVLRERSCLELCVFFLVITVFWSSYGLVDLNLVKKVGFC
ncbi:hypothetical protein Sjap_021678 [Stephania japonica]|uniref:Uncharacterized protein n=1 Tax=Stephania japonica TaxID=461633 RepID=A0AAP0HTP9_9MAGN